MIQSMHVLCFITTHSEFVKLVINDYYNDDDDDCIQASSDLPLACRSIIFKRIVGCKPVAIYLHLNLFSKTTRVDVYFNYDHLAKTVFPSV